MSPPRRSEPLAQKQSATNNHTLLRYDRGQMKVFSFWREHLCQLGEDSEIMRCVGQGYMKVMRFIVAS